MAKISGTVKRSDLEGGMWILEASDGERYQLSGDVASLKDGMRAELTGTIERAMMGFGMGGTNFTVKSVKPA